LGEGDFLSPYVSRKVSDAFKTMFREILSSSDGWIWGKWYQEHLDEDRMMRTGEEIDVREGKKWKKNEGLGTLGKKRN
jgi:hypothetical protein